MSEYLDQVRHEEVEREVVVDERFELWIFIRGVVILLLLAGLVVARALVF